MREFVHAKPTRSHRNPQAQHQRGRQRLCQIRTSEIGNSENALHPQRDQIPERGPHQGSVPIEDERETPPQRRAGRSSRKRDPISRVKSQESRVKKSDERRRGSATLSSSHVVRASTLHRPIIPLKVRQRCHERCKALAVLGICGECEFLCLPRGCQAVRSSLVGEDRDGGMVFLRNPSRGRSET
ncbi:uncharacterized protein BJX67DRAFT_318740 [Aspergillus lucknowensis]|uniref:Uncharacterized protein n=1 Tax=Aspergillus lucknowensis TaxID=176173 RepID=A0ABR4LC06_9EURO